MKTCRNCGRVNSDASQHCIQCGNLLPQQSDNMQNNGSMMKTKNKGLFRNAGAKLKVLALIFFIIDIFVIIGIAAILVSPLIGWLNAIMLYAFGELCENVHDIRNQKR